jgi:mannose-6-phosphate isomerase-like protein (cupin superfamily)
MATPFTHKKLTDVKDSAPEFGLGDDAEARFAKEDLDGESTGVSHHRLKPNKRQPFGHRHEKAEEIYIVISGSGRMKLDDEIIEIETLDAIRVEPTVTRGFEAGDEGLEVVATGARHDGDGEVVPGWWSD